LTIDLVVPVVADNGTGPGRLGQPAASDGAESDVIVRGLCCFDTDDRISP